jgi:hypothetical protein
MKDKFFEIQRKKTQERETGGGGGMNASRKRCPASLKIERDVKRGQREVKIKERRAAI